MPTGSVQVRHELGAARLTLNTDFAVDTITRSDANGTAGVRLREGILPALPAVDLVVDDFEAAAGLVTYTASGLAAGDPARRAFTVSGQMSLETPWLGVPIMQSYAQPIDAVLTYGAGVAGRTTVHEPPGREDPIVILRKMGTRRGSMELWAGLFSRTTDILRALKRGEVMMLRQGENAGQDMYFVAESAGINTLSEEGEESQFSVTVDYVEVARPAGFIASAPGWDFAQLAASAEDFLQIATRYQDFQSLALDERT